MRKMTQVSIGFVLALGGVGCLQVNAEIPEACLKYSDLEFTGVPLPEGTMGTLDQSFVHDELGELKDLFGDHPEAELKLLSVGFEAKKGIRDFTFLQAAAMSVQSGNPSSTLPSLEIMNVGAAAPTTVPFDSDQIEVPSETNESVAPYVQSGSLQFNVEVVGELPKESWAVDVEVCVAGKVQFKQSI